MDTSLPLTRCFCTSAIQAGPALPPLLGSTPFSQFAKRLGAGGSRHGHLVWSSAFGVSGIFGMLRKTEAQCEQGTQQFQSAGSRPGATGRARGERVLFRRERNQVATAPTIQRNRALFAHPGTVND